ncbi:MAG: dihydroxyacetone kinase subunit L [Chloroflexi bacterium]|nr:dihydroxyacetone kinase subunit L [Chloroflexota bacterium]
MSQSEHNIDEQTVAHAMKQVSAAFNAQHEYLTGLDQAMGDGDLGITVTKIATALEQYAQTDPAGDLGKWIAGAGMVVNRAASSTMGTLLATALMRAGKEARGLTELTPAVLSAMLVAADVGIQERGKAKPGDKTVVDALHPAAQAFAEAIAAGIGLKEAGQKMLAAAREGRDRVTPLKSSTGRAGWVGERTVGLVDPGCAAMVILLEALVGIT